ncbi:MAG TPA: SRPBCC family protein [Aeromicrobium sp.]|nr:SRPBCC family protein [Aeromicrobium sp.]
MARTSSDIVIDATPAAVMAVIADFPAYPEWATGMRSVEVVEGPDDRANQVRFVLDATPIRDEYELAYTWDDDRSVSWTLAGSGSMLKAMDGAYLLDPIDEDSTRVTYQLFVDVSIPLLGMLKRKAEKVIIDTALKGLKKRVESLGAS